MKIGLRRSVLERTKVSIRVRDPILVDKDTDKGLLPSGVLPPSVRLTGRPRSCVVYGLFISRLVGRFNVPNSLSSMNPLRVRGAPTTPDLTQEV